MQDVVDMAIAEEFPQDEDTYGVEETVHNEERQDDMDPR